jgi:triacylglycerol lipase
MNWFGRQVGTRIVDYGWAYRLRLKHVARRPDPIALREPRGPSIRRPVVLLPGVYETWHFLEAAGRHLNALGHPVYTIPAFRNNLRPIPEMARLASEYLVEEDLADVAIVAHSKGGLIGKTLMLTEVGASRIASMVAINSPFAGSDYAHLVPIRTLREFVPTHETIVMLAQAGAVNNRITSIFSSWDPIIPNGSRLEGATNLELPVAGHFRILDREDLLAAVAHAVAGG